MIFLLASAVGLYFSGVIDGYLEKEVSAKKLRAVKPKFIRDKVAPVAPDEPVYTFFETLNDTTMTRYVGLNGKLLPTVLPTALPVVPTKTVIPSTPEKQVPSEPLAKPEIKQARNIRAEVGERPRYAVQVSSFRDAERAGALKLRLQKKGFDAFLMQAELANNAGTWHRVFLGRYADEEKAQEAARLARSQYKLNAVVVRKTN
jgi:hypothetical protein